MSFPGISWGMSRTHKRKRIDNSLTQLTGLISRSMTGGSLLSSYSTIAYSNNYSLLTLNRIILTYMYTGNGIYQTAIQLPIQDALSKGIEIESGEMDADDIDEVMDYWDKNDFWGKIENAWSWVRNYGGGALLINTNQDPEKQLNPRLLHKQPFDIYDVDRWQLDTNVVYFDDYENLFAGTQGADDGKRVFHLWGMPVHESRLLRARGKRAPSYVRRQLRGWGMSEGERMIRDLNNYLKTQDVLYEILDQSKLDIYKIKNFANKLLTAGGTNAVAKRIQAANEIKSYINALVLDIEEEYEQKSLTFTGLSEVMQQNRIGVAAALRMPLTKLFGLSASGFNTGESDLENYNQMVESECRRKMTPMMHRMLTLTMYHLWGYAPKFKIKWPPMRVLTAEQEETVKNSKTDRLLAFYDRGLISSEEAMQQAKHDNILSIETAAEKGLVPNPVPPGGTETVTTVDKITPRDPFSREKGPGSDKATG